MTPEPRDARAVSAALVMQQNRDQLRAVFEPAAEPDRFPRSATFRWIAGHLTPQALASTALAAVAVRIPFARLLGQALFGRRH
jgi:hypothetical protein